MEAAYFVVLERPIEDVEPYHTSGKWLSRFSDELDVAAEELGVTPLSQFFSMSADEVQEIIDLRGIGPEALARLPKDLNDAIGGDVEAINRALRAFEQHVANKGVPAEEWFDASAALATLRRLLKCVRTAPERFAQPDYLASDLEEAERILKVAAKQGVRFHMSVNV